MNGPFRRDETRILKKTTNGFAKRRSTLKTPVKNIKFDRKFTRVVKKNGRPFHAKRKFLMRDVCFANASMNQDFGGLEVFLKISGFGTSASRQSLMKRSFVSDRRFGRESGTIGYR